MAETEMTAFMNVTAITCRAIVIPQRVRRKMTIVVDDTVEGQDLG